MAIEQSEINKIQKALDMLAAYITLVGLDGTPNNIDEIKTLYAAIGAVSRLEDKSIYYKDDNKCINCSHMERYIDDIEINYCHVQCKAKDMKSTCKGFKEITICDQCGSRDAGPEYCSQCDEYKAGRCYR